MAHQMIMVLDFGGQNTRLVARRIRECKVYCEVKPYNKVTLDEIKEINPAGIIITGGNKGSVRAENAPEFSKEIFKLGIPVMGIDYGFRFIADTFGASLGEFAVNEFGETETNYDTGSELFKGMESKNIAWNDFKEYVEKLPEGFKSIANTAKCANVAIASADKKIYGVGFNPEVNYTVDGAKVFENFLFNICGCTGDWSMKDYAKTTIEDIKTQVGDGKVLLALSGGVDSSVCAALLSKAIGDQLTCIFVDHGFMRKNEGDEVEAAFKDHNLNFVRVDAKDRFMAKLNGVSDPEKKRKIIGEEFIRVFEEEAKKIGTVDFLAQGTIYPDIIESGTSDGAVVKSHHNVGGLPDYVDFKEIIEPLKYLFKGEVRELGKELGLSEVLVKRQPFPGPGLAVRVIGEITDEKLNILKDADYIFRSEIDKAGLDTQISQYFAVITNMRSVGVRNDARTYDYTVALRAIRTTDFMTADAVRVPYDVLETTSARIVKEVPGVNRIVYDITSKPPATIEWE